MRPVKLEIQAMGPYKNREIIDFTRLGEKRFFLIHGPTGAGKSSILDAMTYALYGETSGDERSLEQMRSHWADSDTESYVIFEFYLRGKLYRIKRSPRQVLNRKRGSGTREVNPEAALWLADEDNCVIETGSLKVTERIEALLGFNSGQFRQVIILPQGKFRELLSAKAEGREEILKVLFATGRFTEIQEMLKSRAGEARRRLDDLRIEREAVLRGEGAESADELTRRGASCKADAEDLKKALKKLESAEKKLQEEMKRAAVIDARFCEREQASEALKALIDREDEIKGYSESINAFRRARGMADIYKSLSEERSIFSGVQDTFNRYREEFVTAEKNKNEAEKLINEIPGKKDELKIIEKDLYRLESSKDIYGELAKTDEEIELKGKLKIDSEMKHLFLSEKRVGLDVRIQRTREQSGEAEIAGVKIQALKLSLERITSAGKKLAEIETSEESVHKFEKELPRIEKKHAAALEEFRKLSSLRIEAEEQWRRGQASILAADLKKGEPCPVCGSLHHPLPAGADNGAPGIAEIEKLRTSEKRADDEVRSFDLEMVKKKTELESVKSRMPSIADVPEEFRGLTRNDLKKKYRDETAELEKLSGKVMEADTLRERLAEDEKNLSEIIKEDEKILSELKGAEVDLASLISRRKQICAGLPEGINSLNELHERIESLLKKSGEIQAFIKSSENTWKEFSEKYSASEALYKKMEKDYKSAGERYTLKENEFNSRLKEEGFKSETEFSALLGDADRLKELEGVVEKYSREVIAARSRLEKADADIGETERPDITALSAKINTARDESDSIIGRIKSAESESFRIDKIAERIRTIEKSAAGEEESYSIIQTLAEISNGRNSRRLTFQRYVLQSLFEEVLMMASNRLERMSRGRYRLISPGKLEDRRATGGLDLEVFDEYTGYSRPVVTLSGGEAFLASLSLALGLADLVQQYAGGIHLDTVFIDEGFGSLDSETLDLAINTLIDLQSSGRLVGIISHVGELKERIDARLEVVPVSCGSTTRFNV